MLSPVVVISIDYYWFFAFYLEVIHRTYISHRLCYSDNCCAASLTLVLIYTDQLALFISLGLSLSLYLVV